MSIFGSAIYHNILSNPGDTNDLLYSPAQVVAAKTSQHPYGGEFGMEQRKVLRYKNRLPPILLKRHIVRRSRAMQRTLSRGAVPYAGLMSDHQQDRWDPGSLDLLTSTV